MTNYTITEHFCKGRKDFIWKITWKRTACIFVGKSILTQKKCICECFTLETRTSRSLNSAHVTRLLFYNLPTCYEPDISWKQRHNILLVTELEQLFYVGFPVPLLIKTHAENYLSPSNNVEVYIQQSENE